MKRFSAPLLALLALACPAVAKNPDPGSGAKPPASSPQGPPQNPPAARPQAAAMRAPTQDELARYPWLSPGAQIRSLKEAFPPPAGFERVGLEIDFGEFLRGLPLRAEGTPVKSYKGEIVRAADDPNVAAVAELDIGSRDLQQCADSIIRLHAEWLFSSGKKEDAAYHFTSGDLATFRRYAAGERPSIAGSKVTWKKTAKADASYPSFRAYLDLVFTYACTL